MIAEPLSCHWSFSGLPIFNFADNYANDSAYKATTLPGLGLTDSFEREYGFNNPLIDSNKKPWENFKIYVDYLNEQNPDTTQYKVLYITRHGLGYHNAFETQVGREAWNHHWSHLDGDGNITWSDSRLNEDGKKQVIELGRFWSNMISDEKVPLPETIYTSPLARCLETTNAVFRKVYGEKGLPFHPVIHELLRERLTDHTCDRRRSRSWITTNFPDFIIDPSFSEEDELWNGERWETADEHAARKQQALENIFSNDNSHFIALTTHSYAISAILTVLGMKSFRVQEGSSIAILVRAVKIPR